MAFLHRIKGQVALQTLLSLAAFAGVFIAPAVYVGNIKEVNAVQDNRIVTLEQTMKDLREDNRLLSSKIDALLIRNGIDPQKLNK